MTLLDSIVESLAQPVDSETISGGAASFGRPYWRFERWMAGGVDSVVEPVTITIVDSEKAGLDRITSRGDKQQRLRTTTTEGVEIKLRLIHLAFLWQRRGLNRVWQLPDTRGASPAPLFAKYSHNAT